LAHLHFFWHSHRRPIVMRILKLIQPCLPLYLTLLVFVIHQPQATQAQTINVALPDTFVTETQSVLIPVEVSDVSNLGILSFSFTISFDPEIISIQDVVSENGLAEGYLFLNNFNVDGQVVIAAAGVDSLNGAGSLFFLEASFLQDGSTEMNFDKASFSEDAFDVEIQNGRLRNISLASVDETDDLPTQQLLSTNYPNPFSYSTTISADLPEAAQVFVEIYDINGRLQRTYPSLFLTAGTNPLVKLEASSLPAGSYVYRVIANSAGTTRLGTGTLTIIH
ncbi:MAG: T9SS type A sorting domain-containing protein, partial [Pseudomonadota bacterium]